MKEKKFQHKLSIVMVAYNEEGHIAAVVRQYYDEVYRRAPRGSEFILYLDGPKDRTREIAMGLRKRLSGLKVVDCLENMGYFTAAKTALSYPKNEHVFFSDSSGKHDPADFWSLAKYSDSFDIVTGLRSNREDTRYRQMLSVMQRLFVSALFLMPLYDFNTGFKLIRKKVLDDILPECDVLPVTFSTELVIRAHRKGYTITNAPVSFRHRGGKERQFAPAKLPGIICRQLTAYMRLRLQLLKS